ncbi:MAG: hypothetical protein V1872_09215 [bacterium]
MKKMFFLLIGLLFFCFFTTTADASYISLNTSVTSTLHKDNTLELIILTINKGDETAYNVQIETIAGEITNLSPSKKDLQINEQYEFKSTFKLILKKPGTYPFGIRIYYTDANQYLFSVLTYHLFSYQKEMVSLIYGNIPPISIAKKGKLKFIVKNLSDNKISLSNFLMLPRELSILQPSRNVTLKARSKEVIIFPVKSVSALPGSTYQVFIVTETEDNNFHYTSISQGTISIVKERAILGVSYPILITIIIILVVIFVIIQVSTGKRVESEY